MARRPEEHWAHLVGSWASMLESLEREVRDPAIVAQIRDAMASLRRLQERLGH